jgi:hypothetical protein
MKMTKPPIRSVPAVLMLVGVGFSVFGIYGWMKAAPMTILAMKSEAASSSREIISISASATQDASQGKRQYSNSAFHFSLLYPENLQVQEYKEQGGAITVSFQDPKTNAGFEVYVTPYGDTQITTQRFKLDEPSGVYQQPTDVIVDGARATMFFGHNGIMGDTREVWMIHSGFLYEVATYKELDSWLAQIMQT